MENNLQTIKIKGKDYVEVNTRVMEFRTNPKYENYTMETEIVSLTDAGVVFKAVVKDGNNRIVSTGFAQEDRNASQINATSFLENCETSAVGRALGFLGIGIKASIASANEVANAVHQQESNPNYSQQKQQHQDEIITKLVKASDGQSYEVNYKKCFNKAQNQYFLALANKEDEQYGFPKYLRYEQ